MSKSRCKACREYYPSKDRVGSFCSASCAASYYAAIDKLKVRRCILCHKEFMHERSDAIYCSYECSHEANLNRQRNRIVDQNGNRISSNQRWSIFSRDGFRCHYCGATPDDGIKLVLDHIIPIAKGGNNADNNLITACNLCNSGKGIGNAP